MQAKIKIYTKTGDKGSTRLVDGRECSKSHLRVETYGTIDELNSVLGLCQNFCDLPDLQKLIFQFQNQLFNIGSHLACENTETRKLLPKLDENWISQIEQSIDQMTLELPELKQFILPGGCSLAAFLHQARTVCRRAERMVVRLLEENDTEPSETEMALRYLNRLSDWLFVSARWSNHKHGVHDIAWQKDH